jgi:hypothetical protein
MTLQGPFMTEEAEGEKFEQGWLTVFRETATLDLDIEYDTPYPSHCRDRTNRLSVHGAYLRGDGDARLIRTMSYTTESDPRRLTAMHAADQRISEDVRHKIYPYEFTKRDTGPKVRQLVRDHHCVAALERIGSLHPRGKLVPADPPRLLGEGGIGFVMLWQWEARDPRSEARKEYAVKFSKKPDDTHEILKDENAWLQRYSGCRYMLQPFPHQIYVDNTNLPALFRSDHHDTCPFVITEVAEHGSLYSLIHRAAYRHLNWVEAAIWQVLEQRKSLYPTIDRFLLSVPNYYVSDICCRRGRLW